MSVAEAVFGRIADGELVIIDGGTGTQLQAEGVPMDDVAWSARANLEQPDVVQHVHEEYIRAGAQVIIAKRTRAAARPWSLPGSGTASPRPTAAPSARPCGPGRWPRRARGGSRLDVVVLPRRHAGRGAGPPLAGPADTDPGFPTLAHFREQAELLAEEGADLIALEMICARGYGRAAVAAAAETGLPVWLGISVFHRQDGTLGTLVELGDGDSVEDLLSALAVPGLAAVTVMHSKPEASLAAVEIIRGHFAGPIGVYAETGDWQPPNWVFGGLPPAGYLQQAITWADSGARLIGGCCGVGPEHIRALTDGLSRHSTPRPGT